MDRNTVIAMINKVTKGEKLDDRNILIVESIGKYATFKLRDSDDYSIEDGFLFLIDHGQNYSSNVAIPLDKLTSITFEHIGD